MKTAPHICILSCQHVPDDKRVTHKEARSFREAGFSVTWVGPEAARSGEDYGVDFKYYRRATGRLARLWHARQLRKLASKVQDVDVYFAVEPDSAAVAVQLARRFKAKAVFDIHEVYHREVLTRWVPNSLLPLVSASVRRHISRTCSKCDLVVAVSEEVLAPYSRTAPRTHILRNCAPVHFAEGAAAEVCAPHRKQFTIVHGFSTLVHGTPTVVRALGLAAQQATDLRVVLFDAFETRRPGDWNREDYQKLVKQCNAEQMMDLRLRVAYSEMPDILRNCDAGIIAYNRQWGTASLPNRLFEYMAAGLPVIVPTYAREIRPIVEQERCGLVVDCENAEEVAEAILYLQQNPDEARAMGRRGRDGFIARHNWQVEVSPLIQHFQEWSQA